MFISCPVIYTSMQIISFIIYFHNLFSYIIYNIQNLEMDKNEIFQVFEIKIKTYNLVYHRKFNL